MNCHWLSINELFTKCSTMIFLISFDLINRYNLFICNVHMHLIQLCFIIINWLTMLFFNSFLLMTIPSEYKKYTTIVICLWVYRFYDWPLKFFCFLLEVKYHYVPSNLLHIDVTEWNLYVKWYKNIVSYP